MDINEEAIEKQQFDDISYIENRANQGIKWNSISLIYRALVSFFIFLILARFLLPEENGLIGILLFIIGIGTVFSDVGISNAIIHYQHASEKQLSTLYWVNFIFGIFLFILCFFISSIISQFYQAPELKSLIRITGLIFIIIPFGHQSETILKKDLHFNTLAIVEIISSTINILATILLIFNGIGPLSFVIAYILEVSLKASLTFYFGLKIWKPKFLFDFPEIKKYLRFGLFQMGDRSLNLYNTNIDKLIIGKLLGLNSLGYYNLAFNLILYPIQLFNTIFTRIAFPYFSKIQQNKKLLKEKYFELIRSVIFINSPVYFYLIVVAPYLVPFFYGIQWTPSIILVQILSFVGLLRCIGNPSGSLLYSKGYVKLAFLWNLSISIIQPPIILIGILLFGMIGGVSFLLLSNIIFFILSYFFLIKKTLGSCFQEFFKSFGYSIIFGLIASLVSYIFGLLFSNPSYSYIIYLIFHFVIISIVYITLNMLFKKEILFQFFERFFVNIKIFYDL